MPMATTGGNSLPDRDVFAFMLRPLLFYNIKLRYPVSFQFHMCIMRSLYAPFFADFY